MQGTPALLPLEDAAAAANRTCGWKTGVSGSGMCDSRRQRPPSAGPVEGGVQEALKVLSRPPLASTLSSETS